mmetsp:Transcript_6008/g.16919  ORF Transcript_6008/g.16919 Transcript_6008/m.16919 type:complete len:257 (-) Transcript_6008:65-835(-)
MTRRSNRLLKTPLLAEGRPHVIYLPANGQHFRPNLLDVVAGGHTLQPHAAVHKIAYANLAVLWRLPLQDAEELGDVLDGEPQVLELVGDLCPTEAFVEVREREVTVVLFGDLPPMGAHLFSHQLLLPVVAQSYGLPVWGQLLEGRVHKNTSDDVYERNLHEGHKEEVDDRGDPACACDGIVGERPVVATRRRLIQGEHRLLDGAVHQQEFRTQTLGGVACVVTYLLEVVSSADYQEQGEHVQNHRQHKDTPNEIHH